MSLTFDNTELGMVLPLREQRNLTEYFEVLLPEFQELATSDPQQSPICTHSDGYALVLTSDPADSGESFQYVGCNLQDATLRLQPRTLLFREPTPNMILMLLAIGKTVYMGFSRWNKTEAGILHFKHPNHLYARELRGDKRVQLENGNAIIRRLDGRQLSCRIHDFSPSGASFLVGEDFAPGEPLMITFKIPDCGTCETAATVVRQAPLSAEGRYRNLIGVSLSLTQEQRQKAEQLYLCKKGAHIKSIVDSSRSSIG
ncbi:PilZ domain-containing protein [Acidithiobacillus sp. AMEEHan]|uniref:PilZ domain-containing protein n=1 Tax=Acidithiobacillus sp. AMEEHan TaxID=2994951 RepID=UPI0027E57C8E|nr:PilZ domain-containing protein [Acidithiobacillus sp. AMEEHan]